MGFLDASADPARQSLIDVRNRLLQLHKFLLDDEKRTYEKVHGPIASPGAFLQLLLSDSWFAWLRPITAIVADIDDALAAKQPVTDDVAEEWLKRVKGLLVETEGGNGLGKAYFDALQRNPDVAVLHGQVVTICTTFLAQRHLS